MHGGRIAPSEGGREGGNEGWGEGGGREWWKEGRGQGWREDGGTESGSERGGNEGWGRRDGGSERKRQRCRKINLTASFLDSALLIAGGHFGAYHSSSSSSCAIGVLVRWCGGAVWRQPSPGVNTFPINKRLLTGVLTVTDDEVRYAMRVAFETLQVGAHSPEEAERHMGASKQDPLPPSSSSPPPPFFGSPPLVAWGAVPSGSTISYCSSGWLPLARLGLGFGGRHPTATGKRLPPTQQKPEAMPTLACSRLESPSLRANGGPQCAEVG